MTFSVYYKKKFLLYYVLTIKINQGSVAFFEILYTMNENGRQ